MKRNLEVLLSIMVIMVTLAGCGGSPKNETGTQDATAETTTEDSTTETATSETTGGDAIQVDVWHYFENEADALEQFASEYNEMQDEIEITCTYISRDELMKQYTIGAVSGELPDIGMVDSPDMSSYIALGVFENITEELNAWGELDKFYAGPLSSCMDAEGNIYGLPNNSNCLALACNMDILNAAGFTAPPTTWEEFEAVAKATTDPANEVYGFAMSAIGNEEGTFQYIPWLYASGATVASVGSPEGIKSIDFLSKLVSNGYMSKEVVNWGQGDAYNAFVAQKAAMLESGTWQLSTIDTDVNSTFKYQYAFLPKDKNYATVIGGENFGVCVGSEARDACVKFLQYMQTAQKNADWCEIAGKLPVRSDAAELKEFWTADPRYAIFTDAMNYSVPRGPHEEWPTISKAIYSAEQAALIGEKTPEEAMTEAAAIIDPILEKTPLAGAK